MPIDTAAKRRAAAGMAFPGLPLGLGVSPNAAADKFWRYSVAAAYLADVTTGLSYVTTPAGSALSYTTGPPDTALVYIHPKGG